MSVSADLALLECPDGHQYYSRTCMEGTGCLLCGKTMRIAKEAPVGEARLEGDTPFGESSAAEHQPLKLGDAGSNPAPRSNRQRGYSHPARASFNGRTTGLEPDNGGSTPPARSIPLRRGYEVTLSNDSTLGWFHTREDTMVLMAGGKALASMTPEEWSTFLDYARETDEANPPSDHVGALREENALLRLAAAEALQAVEEATDVVEKLTTERDAARVEAAGLRKRNAELAATISGLRRYEPSGVADLERFATEAERVATNLAQKSTVSMFDRITLESLAILARTTRERGETVDAAGPNPAGETHEGSTPSAPTNPVSYRRYRFTNSPPYVFETMIGADEPE